MASYSKTIICGNLGRDPETRHLASGESVTNFSVAVTESWKTKDGEKKENTTWYRVNAFGKLSDICSTWLKKGSQVLIEGKMGSRKWTDKDGIERESWELKADQMQMLGGRQDNQSSGQTDHGREKADGYAPAPKPQPKPGYDDSDIPF
jgi:single-strand DNA-binding protein